MSVTESMSASPEKTQLFKATMVNRRLLAGCDVLTTSIDRVFRCPSKGTPLPLSKLFTPDSRFSLQLLPNPFFSMATHKWLRPLLYYGDEGMGRARNTSRSFMLCRLELMNLSPQTSCMWRVRLCRYLASSFVEREPCLGVISAGHFGCTETAQKEKKDMKTFSTGAALV